MYQLVVIYWLINMFSSSIKFALSSRQNLCKRRGYGLAKLGFDPKDLRKRTISEEFLIDLGVINWGTSV